MADNMLSPLSNLEQSMGIQRDAMDIDGFVPNGGLPDEDPDSTPEGRAAVSYSTAGDSLFSPPSGNGANTAANNDDDAAPDLGVLMGLLGDPSGALGAGAPALIAQLEAMAEEFERQSGEPETEIRGKIAMLRSVLDARPQAVAQSRARMDAAVAALDAEDMAARNEAALGVGRNGGGGAAAAAMHSVTSSAVSEIEGGLAKVERTLQSDPASAALVSELLSGKK